MRTKRNASKANRPWSVACISSLQGSNAKHFTDEKRILNQTSLYNFSISESALHELAALSVRTNTNNLAQSVKNMGAITNSTGTSQFSPTNKPYSNRKKIRSRKNTSSSGNGHNTGSDYCNSSTSLHKSETYSQTRTSLSDPQQQPTESDDSDFDANNKTLCENLEQVMEVRKPAFKLGEKVLVPIKTCQGIDRDSSPEKHNSMNTNGTEEHSSSLSEWDNYLVSQFLI